MSYNEIVMNGKLYKRGTKGEIRVWTMELGFNSEDDAGYRTVAGIKDGKLVISEWKKANPKNVGRANATTALEQAKAEIESGYTKKRDTGYFDSIEAIDNFDKFKPMLAVNYEAKKVNFDDTIYSQPKLDGIRCIARKDGLWSRQGKPITSCPHIEEYLKPFFDKYPYAILDGELYNHKFKDDFNKITSMVRKTKFKEADLEETRQLVEYHVYDTYLDEAFDARNTFIQEQEFSLPIVSVQTTQVRSLEELDELYGEYLTDGYEGQMVRVNSSYENKRSKFLIKRKEFITEEYLVVGVSEGQGNWSGAIKRFHLVQADGYPFDAGVRGSYEKMKELFESGVQPEWATLRYFALTPDGVPRFPVVIDWGTGQRED